MDRDVATIARHAAEVLPVASGSLPDEYFYQSLPCVVDAVFSIGVRYDGVRRVVRRYAEHFGLALFRENRGAPGPEAHQESLLAFCDHYEQHGVEGMTRIFQNRQRTSTRNGILKADAVYRFANVLRLHGIEHLLDVSGAGSSPQLERDIRAIPGQGSGVCFKYFLMLAGDENQIKPDRMVLRFLSAALDRPVSVSAAAELLPAVAAELASEYSHVTPRRLDYLVWNFQRQAAPRASRGQGSSVD